MHTYSDAGNSSSEVYNTTTSKLLLSDSDCDPSDLPLSSDSLAPSPKQSRIEQESEPEPEVSAVNTDVADVAKRGSVLTDREKNNFYCNHFSPDIDFKFPREKSRGFQHQYLRSKWLVYSQQQNGGYCLPCVLFAKSTDVRKGKGAFGAFVERAFTKACDAFIEMMSGRRESVAIQLRVGLRDTIQRNRQKFHSIVETLVLCGRQNISIRGHRDSGTDVEGAQSASTNHGNFWALLNF